MRTCKAFVATLLLSLTVVFDGTAGAQNWTLAGNAGINPATNFLGTTDGTPLVIRTRNDRRLQIEPYGDTRFFLTPDAAVNLTVGVPYSNNPVLVPGRTQIGLDLIKNSDLQPPPGGPPVIFNGFPNVARILFSSGANFVDPNANSGTLGFYTRGAADPTAVERVRITDTGNVGIGTSQPAARLDVAGTIRSSAGGFLFPDGSMQITAQLQGAPGRDGTNGRDGVNGRDGTNGHDGTNGRDGRDGRNGSPGAPGFQLPPQVAIRQNVAGGGFIALLGPGNAEIVQLTSINGAPNNGFIAVTDAAGAAQGIARAGLGVSTTGLGTLIADVKNFRVPNPDQPRTDIVYACLEGPEAAAYVRGTSQLVNGSGQIALPGHFISVASPEGMTVQVTPLSADSLGLAVVTKRLSGVVVKELQRGTGNYAFDWEVKCVRKGHEKYQVIRPSSEMALSGSTR